jgi:hypothetical protein
MDLYHDLGVSHDATSEVINECYQRRYQEDFSESIRHAGNILTSTKARTMYDHGERSLAYLLSVAEGDKRLTSEHFKRPIDEQTIECYTPNPHDHYSRVLYTSKIDMDERIHGDPNHLFQQLIATRTEDDIKYAPVRPERTPDFSLSIPLALQCPYEARDRVIRNFMKDIKPCNESVKITDYLHQTITTTAPTATEVNGDGSSFMKLDNFTINKIIRMIDIEQLVFLSAVNHRLRRLCRHLFNLKELLMYSFTVPDVVYSNISSARCMTEEVRQYSTLWKNCSVSQLKLYRSRLCMLYWCILFSNESCIKFLLDKLHCLEVDPMYIVLSGNTDLFRWIPYDPSAISTAQMWALRSRNVEMLKYVELKQPLDYSITLIMNSLQLNSRDCTTYLLSKYLGNDENILINALQQEDTQTVETMEKRGCVIIDPENECAHMLYGGHAHGFIYVSEHYHVNLNQFLDLHGKDLMSSGRLEIYVYLHQKTGGWDSMIAMGTIMLHHEETFRYLCQHQYPWSSIHTSLMAGLGRLDFLQQMDPSLFDEATRGIAMSYNKTECVRYFEQFPL